MRHGITVWNREARWQGHTDVPLSEEGIKQAEQASHRLKSEDIRAVWSSDLKRAAVTADLIAKPHGLEVQTSLALRETMLGDWEGLTIPELIARGDEDTWLAMKNGSMNHRPPNSEPLEEMWNRIVEQFHLIKSGHDEGAIVIVGHGGSLRAILCDALGAGLPSLTRFQLENASISTLDFNEHRSWVKSVNVTCHLKPL